MENRSCKQAAPFVKWVGGKRNIKDSLISKLPFQFNNYYEPFAGGGALFFELYKRLKQAYLSDSNLDLILAYKVIEKNPNELIEFLKIHAKKHNKEYYYKIRQQHELQDAIEIAARFIYLNKTCYNGLYRVNKSGRFNVPVGSYNNPNIIQENNILACNQALESAVIRYQDFRDIKPDKGDFVYFDPPYYPVNATSQFTSYTKSDFSEKDQIDLRNLALRLHKSGVLVMISNSNTEFIRGLYKGGIFNAHIVNAPRYVNSKADARGPVEELLILNYKVK